VLLPRLVLRNAFRHKLRTTLTIVGIVVAITAFGMLRTIVDAWYAGANASSSARLVTRNAVSLVFPLPLTLRRLRRCRVASITRANWFGGVYVSERNLFAQFAVDAPSYLDMYPEIVLPPEERRAFLADRTGAIVGRKLAERFGWKVGDPIPLRGTIFPGTWTFTLRGIYDGAEAATDTSTMFFHWQYLNEALKRSFPRRAEQTGVFIERSDPAGGGVARRRRSRTARRDATETEKAFQLLFAMAQTILLAIELVSFVVIVIIMAVMANTMAMTARERSAEYATLKALGFSGGYVAAMIFAESLAIAVAGGMLGIAASFPLTAAFAATVGSLLPSVQVSPQTVAMQLAAAAVVGVVAAGLPAWRAARISIVDGLRAVG
jgi:putative ABC transport system permease protein